MSEDWNRNMVWIKYLKKTPTKDVRTFNRWINDEINLDECINEFRDNNRIPDSVYIDIIEFASWLKGLGWVKYETDKI